MQWNHVNRTTQQDLQMLGLSDDEYTGTSLLRASLQRGFGYKAVGTLDPNVLGIKGGRLQGQVIVLPTVYWFPFGTHAGRRIDL